MIYDFRILPFALGDVVISMIHGAIDLKGKTSKFPFYYFRNDFEKAHPIQRFINKQNVNKHLGDLNEALLFNPFQLPIKEIRKKPNNAGCETSQELIICDFYDEYKNKNQVKEYHNYFNSNIASHKFLNQFSQEKNQIPQLHASKNLILKTKKLIKKHTGKNKWICAHLRFRGIEKDADFADIKRNADPGFWYGMLTNIAKEYKNDHAVLLLGPKGSYPESFYGIPNLYAVSSLGGTLKNSITAILSSTAFIGSSSGFANCATFSNTSYLIFDVSENGYENYCIEYDSPRLPFAKKQQHLSSQSDSPKMVAEKLRGILPRLNDISQPIPDDCEINIAKTKYKRIGAFSHVVSKKMRKLTDKPDKSLFSEICLLEKVVPELKEDAILKWVKSKSLLGLYEDQARAEEYFAKIKELKLKSSDAKIKQILHNPKIQIKSAMTLYHINWSTFSRDLDARAIRNLLGRLNSLGVQAIGRENFKILFLFWKFWYRIFYRPFTRFRF
jgi:hypothetical protein